MSSQEVVHQALSYHRELHHVMLRHGALHHGLLHHEVLHHVLACAVAGSNIIACISTVYTVNTCRMSRNTGTYI